MDKTNIKIKGNIRVTSNKVGIIYNNHNTITSDALEILIISLYQGNGTKGIDTIIVQGDIIGEYERPIISSVYNPTDNTITFKVIFYESDFDGEINSMQLTSNTIDGLVFASKEDLSLLKDGESRIQIEWKIQINLC